MTRRKWFGPGATAQDELFRRKQHAPGGSKRCSPRMSTLVPWQRWKLFQEKTKFSTTMIDIFLRYICIVGPPYIDRRVVSYVLVALSCAIYSSVLERQCFFSPLYACSMVFLSSFAWCIWRHTRSWLHTFSGGWGVSLGGAICIYHKCEDETSLFCTLAHSIPKNRNTIP